jgi:hypothetical protein
MYRYRLRPAYGSKELLIELLPESADQAFFGELLGVLKQVNANVTDVLDLWMNDEVLLTFESDLGPFGYQRTYGISFLSWPRGINPRFSR